MPIRRNVTESADVIAPHRRMTGQTAAVGISATGRTAKAYNPREVAGQLLNSNAQKIASAATHHTRAENAVSLASHTHTQRAGVELRSGGDGLRSGGEGVEFTGGGATTTGPRSSGTESDRLLYLSEKEGNRNQLLNALREDLAPIARNVGHVDICDVRYAPGGLEMSSIAHVEVATRENATKCHANEDRSLHGTCGPVNVFGVMDGHDGTYAVNLVQDTFLKLFEAELKIKKNVTSAVTETIARIENKLAEKQSSSGACSLICFHFDRYVWCANLGDCRACFIPLTAKCQVTGGIGKPNDKVNYIGRNTTSLVWLSRDMKSCQSYERERIERAGGRVVDGRVEGLEPSRTVGDFDVKMRCPPSVISIEPEFRLLDLHDYGPGIILCCTDGIWDVLSGVDIDRIVKSRQPMLEADLCGKQNECLSAIAKDVVELAIARHSADDCTAVCALVDG